MSQLGPYALEAELGRGGMGIVLRARDTRDGRTVALKTLLDPNVDVDQLERFRREATALDGVTHPNLVQILDAHIGPPRPYVVFEFVEGGTLKTLVERDGPLPWVEAVRLLLDVAAGVTAVHAHGALHRDVKPDNVLLGQGGAKLADFGLVKVLDKQTLTRSGSVMGTPSYLSPEQTSAERGAWSPSTDVYGMSATLYYALTGKPPFWGPTTVATLVAVLEQPPPSAREHAPTVPEWLDAVCRRGMAKDPAQRYRSAEAFRAALEAGLASDLVAPQLTRAHLGLALLALALLCGAVALGLEALKVGAPATQDGPPSPPGARPEPPATTEPPPPAEPPAVIAPPAPPAFVPKNPWARLILPLELSRQVAQLEHQEKFLEAAALLEADADPQLSWADAALDLGLRLRSRARLEANPSTAEPLKRLRLLSSPLSSPEKTRAFLEALEELRSTTAAQIENLLDRDVFVQRGYAIAANALRTLLRDPEGLEFTQVEGVLLLRYLARAEDPPAEPQLLWSLVQQAYTINPEWLPPEELCALTARASATPLHPADLTYGYQLTQLAALCARQEPPDLEQARALLETCLRLPKLGPDVRVSAAKASLEAGSPELALQLVRPLRDGRVPDLFRWKAVLIEGFASKRLGRGEDWLAEMVEQGKFDSSWIPYLGRACAYVHLGRWKEAQQLVDPKEVAVRFGKQIPKTPDGQLDWAAVNRQAAFTQAHGFVVAAVSAEDSQLLSPIPGRTPR
ncbi:MAG: serine/threonine protein kinase [Planctomycetes bacterium]|nr:serine/threonine protein kinase [Planctomycetota bacterium]